MAERGIEPIDWNASVSDGPVDDVVVADAAGIGRPTAEQAAEPRDVDDVIPEVEWDSDEDAGRVLVELPLEPERSVCTDGLRPYREFRGSVPAVDSPPRAIADGIAEIVAVEGPICENRLVQVYARAAGVRLGRLIREAIEKGISSAARRGLIDVSLVTRSTGRVIRLPEQPEVLVRERGPRTLETIPLDEIAAVVSRCHNEVIDADDRELVFREVMALYDLQRMTQSVRDMLSLAGPLTDRQVDNV